MTEQRCPKCGSPKANRIKTEDYYECSSFKRKGMDFYQSGHCADVESAYNRGREDAAPQPSLPSDEEAEGFLDNLDGDAPCCGCATDFNEGAMSMLRYLRTKAQGGSNDV